MTAFAPAPPARLAVTLGDPRGIGPEVMSVAARRFLDEDPGVELLVLGPAGADPGVGEYRAMGTWEGSEVSAGAVSFAALENAVGLAMEGVVAGIVTGPVHKPALQAAGSRHPGPDRVAAGARRGGRIRDAHVCRADAPGGSPSGSAGHPAHPAGAGRFAGDGNPARSTDPPHARGAADGLGHCRAAGRAVCAQPARVRWRPLRR